MEKSKISQIIFSFNLKEKEQFAEFLCSGLVAKNQNAIKLYGLLKDEKEWLEKESIFKKIFAGEKFDDKKLRYLFSDLTSLAEEFVALSGFLKEDKLKQTILANELAARNCEKSYNAVYRNYIEAGKLEEKRDAEYYYYKYYFEHTHLSLEIARQKRNESTNIESVLDNLDKFYLVRKLQLCCEVYNVKNVLSINYKAFLLDEILSYLSKNKYEDTPAITIYYEILMTLFESEKEEHFLKLRELLLKNEKTFSKEELREMYQYVLNYCIKKINLGNLNYQKELFETYKVIISNQVILLGKFFSQWDFKNIVTISCRVKEFVWAEKFINANKEKLKPEERENAFVYNLAYLNFQKGKYPETLNLLQKVEFTDLYYQLDTKVILLKIFYEQNDDEGFEYHSNAFKVYLNRNKLISDYQRVIYLNLIRFTIRLLKAGVNVKKLSELKTEIEGNPQVADLQWLLKKVEEVKGDNFS